MKLLRTCLALGILATGLSAEVVVKRQTDGSILLSNSFRIGRVGSGSYDLPAPSRERVRELISRHANRWQLDPKLVEAVVTAESGWNPRVVSRKGAVGLMQLMPTTARMLAVEDPYNPEQNIAGGVRYLRQLLDQYDGSLELALAGYNAGPRAVASYGGVPPYRETRDYVRKVLRLYRGETPSFTGMQAALSGRLTHLTRDVTGRYLLTTSAATGR